MSMGNFLGGDGLPPPVMSSKNRATVGMAHPTVVPTNFEPEPESEPERCPECGGPGDEEVVTERR